MSEKTDKPSGPRAVAELKQHDLFASLSDEDLALLLELAEEVRMGKDGVIFTEGEIGKKFYTIVSGEVQIRRERSGKVLTSLRQGEMFGEMAVLDNQPRSATAAASSDTVMLAFEGLKILERYPHLTVKLLCNLARTLTKRLREANVIIDRY